MGYFKNRLRALGWVCSMVQVSGAANRKAASAWGRVFKRLAAFLPSFTSLDRCTLQGILGESIADISFSPRCQPGIY
jgi:hypothetical protein